MARDKIDNPASALSSIFNSMTKINMEKLKLKNQMMQERLKRQGGLEDFALKETFKGEQAQAKLGEQRSYDEAKSQREREYKETQEQEKRSYDETKAVNTRQAGMEDFYTKEDYKRANPAPAKEKVPPQENYAKVAKEINNLNLKKKMGTLSGDEAEYLKILQAKFYGKEDPIARLLEEEDSTENEYLGEAELEVGVRYEGEDGTIQKYLGNGKWEAE